MTAEVTEELFNCWRQTHEMWLIDCEPADKTPKVIAAYKAFRKAKLCSCAAMNAALHFGNAIAEAEERGRIEERVRCLAEVLLTAEMARNGNVSFASFVLAVVAGLKDGDTEPSQSWLDAARKELGK